MAQNPRQFSMVAGFMVAVFAGVMLAASLYHKVTASRTLSDGVVAQATVSSIDTARRQTKNGTEEWQIGVNYTTPGGPVSTVVRDGVSDDEARPLASGSPVAIVYAPAHPDTAWLQSTLQRQTSSTVPVATAIVTVLGIGVGLWGRKTAI